MLKILHLILLYFSFSAALLAQADFFLHATEAPEIEWEERAGGMGYHLFNKMVTDSKNNTYVAGYQEGHTKYGIADYDIERNKVGLVLIKLDSRGEVLWYKKSESGEDFEQITTVAVDKNDDVVVVKRVNYTSYIIKYSSNGNKLFEKKIDNGGIGMDMLIDDVGNIHIAFAIYERAVLVNKFSPTGDILWSRRIETDHIYPKQLALNPNGSVYMLCDFLTDYNYKLLIRDGINNNILRETESFSRVSYEDHNGVAVAGFSSDGNILFFCKDIIRNGDYRYPIDSSIGMTFNPATDELCIAGQYEDEDYRFLTIDAERGNKKEETLITNVNTSNVGSPMFVDMQVKNETIYLLSLSHDIYTYNFLDLSPKNTYIFDKYGSNTQNFDSEFGSPAQKYFPDPDYYTIDEALEMAVYDDGKVILSVDGNSRTSQNNQVLISGGSSNMAFIQIAPNGSINWAKDGDEFGLEVQIAQTIDEDGNLYVLGFQRGNSTFGNNTLDYQTDSEGRVLHTIYIVKYDRFGNVIWINQSDKCLTPDFYLTNYENYSIEVFEDKVYCLGDFKDVTFFSHSPNFQTKCNYLRFDANSGRLEKMERIITPTVRLDFDGRHEIQTIKDGNIYVLDKFRLIKINQEASVEYDFEIGELLDDREKLDVTGIKVGGNGDIYLALRIYTSDRYRQDPLPFKIAGTQYSSKANSIFIAKANPQGAIQWVKDISNQGVYGSIFTLNPQTNEIYMQVRTINDSNENNTITTRLAKFNANGNKIWVKAYSFEQPEGVVNTPLAPITFQSSAVSGDGLEWRDEHLYWLGNQYRERGQAAPIFIKVDKDGNLIYRKNLLTKYKSGSTNAIARAVGNSIYYLPNEHYSQVGSGDITISEFRLEKYGRVHKLQKQSAQIYDNFTEGATYQWYRNGSLLPATGRTLTITTGGKYSVVKTINGQVVNSDTLVFNRYELIADIEQEDNSLLCGFSGEKLTAKKQLDNTTYYWYTNDELIQADQEPFFSKVKEGTHKYKLVVVRDGYSAADSVTITRIRSITPRTRRIGTSSTDLCEGETAKLEVTLGTRTPVPATIPTKIQWYLNGRVIVGETHHEIITDKEGDYSATYTVGDCFYEDSRNRTTRIDVRKVPTIKIIQVGLDSLDITPNANVTSIRWFRDGREVTELRGTTKYYTRKRSGIYTAIAEVYGVCETQLSAEFTYTAPVEDDEDDDDDDDDILSNESLIQSQVSFYPNPTSGNLIVDMKTLIPTNKKVIIIISDMLGRELFHQSYSTSKQKYNIDLTKYSTGIYNIQLIWDEKIQVRGKINKK